MGDDRVGLSGNTTCRGRWPAVAMLMLAVLAAAPATAQRAQPVPVQLASSVVSIDTGAGEPVRGYISIFLEVPTEKAASRLCSLLPKVHDAIALTFEGRPVRSEGGTYDLADHARRLRERLNAAFGEPIVLRLFLRQGLSEMASGKMLLPLEGTTRTCRALKMLPWEAHLPRLDREMPERRTFGPAVVVERPEGDGAEEGILDALLTPLGLFAFVSSAGLLLLLGGGAGWYVARRRREQRRRERRGERDRRRGERRSGVDRRKSDKGYAGVERRSGKDRRQEDRRTGDRRGRDRRDKDADDS